MSPDEDPAAGDAPVIPFSLGDGVVLVVWTFLAQIVVALALAPLQLAGLEFDDPLVVAVATVGGSLVTLGGVLGWLGLRGRLSWQLIGSALPAPRHLLQGLGAGIVGLVVVFAYQFGVDQIVGPLPPPQQSVLQLIRDGGVAVAALAVTVAVALAPVVEELVFRGVLFQALQRRWRLWPAVFGSAVVFALAHVELYLPPFADPPSPWALGALVLLAAWLAGVFARTRSLVVPVVAHAAFNGVVILVALSVG